MSIRTTGSRIVYENPWMRVREDSIERADGSPGIYGVVEKTDFVVVIPLDGDAVWLVDQYRYPIRARCLEFPQGSWEADPGADPAEVARGELREETGLEAGRLERLGRLYQAYGYSTQAMHVFLATDLRRGERALSPEEQDMGLEQVSLEAFEEMMRDGTITDASTLAAYALLQLGAPSGGAGAGSPLAG